MLDIRADQLDRLIVELRRVDKDLRRELYRGANSATKPMRQDMQASILPSLPSRGGLASEMHRNTSLTTSLRSGRFAGASVRVRGRSSLRRMNRSGVFRHPVFGNREKWVEQSAGVRKGFLDEPFDRQVPNVRKELLKAIDRVAAILYRKV